MSDRTIAALIDDQHAVLSEWMSEAMNGAPATATDRTDGLHLLQQIAPVPLGAQRIDLNDAPYAELRRILDAITASRAARGSSAGETSRFILSLKRPLFERLRSVSSNGSSPLDELWAMNRVVDQLAQYTAEIYQRSREDVILRQQQDLLELSTPVVKLWEGVLAVPMIGTLDSARTQIVMETLLQRIVEYNAELAIIDITGVPTVDTLVAQHLIKTVTAIRLMGSDCIISGIRPQIAQTIVHLGIELEGITTRASLADALTLALQRTGYAVSRSR